MSKRIKIWKPWVKAAKRDRKILKCCDELPDPGSYPEGAVVVFLGWIFERVTVKRVRRTESSTLKFLHPDRSLPNDTIVVRKSDNSTLGAIKREGFHAVGVNEILLTREDLKGLLKEMKRSFPMDFERKEDEKDTGIPL